MDGKCHHVYIYIAYMDPMGISHDFPLNHLDIPVSCGMTASSPCYARQSAEMLNVTIFP